MFANLLPWIIFFIIIIILLYVDLGIFQKRSHKVSLKESLVWTMVWISAALLFNLGIYVKSGPEPALNYLTGYLLEKSLSVDNIFVFLLIFSYFKIADEYQHKVLFWGIIGALAMRAVFIGAGVALMHAFHYIIYFFGVILIITSIRMLLDKNKEIHPDKNPVLNLFRRFFPVSGLSGGRFITRNESGRVFATPLLIVLIVIETTDVVFAADSIPAILAITDDPFIVFTSNIFAILGLRSLYFAISGIMKIFKYLSYGLSAILAFIGIKMLVSDLIRIPIGVALMVIAGILAISIILSVFSMKKQKK